MKKLLAALFIIGSFTVAIEARAATSEVILTPTSAMITNNSALLGATISYAGVAPVITDYGVCIKVGLADSCKGVSGSIDSFRINWSGLTPSTSYKYKAYIVSNAGVFYTPETTFTTLSTSPASDSSCKITKFDINPKVITLGDSVSVSYETSGCGTTGKGLELRYAGFMSTTNPDWQTATTYRDFPTGGSLGSMNITPEYSTNYVFWTSDNNGGTIKSSPILITIDDTAGWSGWSDYTSCSSSGSKQQVRQCSNPSLGCSGNSGRIISCTASVSCTATLSASPTTIAQGGSTTLSWTSSNCSSIYISGLGNMTSLNGSKLISPTITTDYELTARESSSDFQKKLVRVTVTDGLKSAVVVPDTTPTTPIQSCTATISASPTIVTLGEKVTISWTSNNCSSIFISGLGDMTSLSGSKVVTPKVTTNYELTASASSSNFERRLVRVTVNPVVSTSVPDYSQNEEEGCRVGDTYSPTTGHRCVTATYQSACSISGVGCDSNRLSISRTLRRGTIGDDVKTLQLYLNLKADGSFGPNTQQKVIEWQRNNRLTPDGIFGAISRKTAGLE